MLRLPLSCRALANVCQEHNAAQKSKPREMRIRFNSTEARNNVPELDPSFVYVDTIFFTPKHVQTLWKKSVKVSTSDFAHGRRSDYGLVFGIRNLLDCDSNIGLHTATICVGNEDKVAWLRLNDATKNGNPGWDEKSTIDISDHDKGGEEAFPESFQHASSMLDYLHRYKAIMKGGGKEAAQFYERCHRARSPEELASIKSEMPPATAELLSKVDDARQYPVAMPNGGNNTGITSSSYSESFNNCIAEERQLCMASAYKKLVVKERDRFIRSKEQAAACESIVPPRVAATQAWSRVAALRIDQCKITFLDEGKKVALVPGLTDSSRFFKVDLREVKNGGKNACDGLCMVLKRDPCPHARAAAMAAGMDIHGLMNPLLTTAAWKDQYADLDFPLPSQAEIDGYAHLINRNIRLPPALKRKKGRPKENKRKKGPLSPKGAKTKRTMTCQVCFARDGHTKKTAPCETPGAPRGRSKPSGRPLSHLRRPHDYPKLL